MGVLLSRGRLSIPKKTGALVLVAVLAAVSILALPVHDVRAQQSGNPGDYILLPNNQSAPMCAGFGGFWTNSTVTCTIDGRGQLVTGSSLNIYAGVTLMIGRGASLLNLAFVDNNGTIANSGLITNEGSLLNGGVITNNGTFTNSGAGTILNSGTITNDGTFTNTHIIYNEAAGTINGYAITEVSRGTISNSGTISTESGSAPIPPASPTGTIALGAVLVIVVLGAVVYFLRSRGIMFVGRKLPPSPVSAPAVQTEGVQWIDIRTGEKVPAVKKLLPPEGAMLDKADPTRAFNEKSGDKYSLDSGDKAWIDIKSGSKIPAVEGYAPPEGAKVDKADPNSAVNPATGARYVIYDPGSYARFFHEGTK